MYTFFSRWEFKLNAKSKIKNAGKGIMWLSGWRREINPNGVVKIKT